MSSRLKPAPKRNFIDPHRITLLRQVRSSYRLQPRKANWSYLEKHMADYLTLSRVLLGIVLIVSGLVEGRAVLARDIWILVLAWSTDIVDGRISRSLSPGHHSWIGKNDVYIDMFFSLAVLAYLVVTGLLPVALVLVYLLVWVVLFAKWGIPDVFAQVFQNPIYAFFVFLTVQSAPQVLPWLLLWALVAALLFGSRMVQLLKNFFKGRHVK
jgi:phosphatidylglycerophosphate synthase